MPYASNAGVKLHYEVSGEGPPLLFIHANPFDRRLWMYQVAELSARFRCIAMDIRGYGRSDKPETRFTLADMTNDALAVLAAEGVSRAIWCGCSVGSGIALMATLDHPDRVSAAILVGGNSKGSASVKTRVTGFEQTRDLKAFIAGYIGELVAPDFPTTRLGSWVLKLFIGQAPRLSQQAIANVHRARGACDMSGRLGEITLPVLVINGAHDNSLASGKATAAGIATARHVTIEGAGHACPIEDPATFNAEVQRFLEANGMWPAAN